MEAERSSGDTRTKMLEVAEGEFARRGYDGAHLQHIAAQVGVQKTALYYYFESKAALYEAVLVRMLEAFDGRVREALERPGSPEERAIRLLDGMNDLLAEHPNYSKMLIRVFVDWGPLQPDRVGPLIERVVSRVLRFYREGVDAGTFVRQSSRHVFQSLLGAVTFHYASGGFGARVLGVSDLFTRSTVAWRREEARSLFLRSILRPSGAGES
jgi:TetR/AcrR family transcriptional regulator